MFLIIGIVLIYIIILITQLSKISQTIFISKLLCCQIPKEDTVYLQFNIPP